MAASLPLLLIAGLTMVLAAHQGLQVAAAAPVDSAAAESGDPQSIRPAAGVMLDDHRTLVVADAARGGLLLVDLSARNVAANATVGQQLSDVAAVPMDAAAAGDWLLATDQAAHELILVHRRGDDVSRASSAPTPRFPVSVCVDASGRRAAVAGLWSRKLALFDVVVDAAAPELREAELLDLPFAPRLQKLLPDGRHVVVAEGFGGGLAIVDLMNGRIVRTAELPGGNLRGLALSADGQRLAVAEQSVNPLARTTTDDIHWGLLVQNVVRFVDVAALLDPNADVVRRSRVLVLGQPGFGAADPAGLAPIGEDEWLVLLAGAGDAMLIREDETTRARLPVGPRPIQLAASPDGRLAVVLSPLSNLVILLDPVEGRRIGEVELGPPGDDVPALRGERLFGDASLSHDKWLSCESCHPGGHASGQLADTFSDGSFGTSKRTLTLLGTRDANPWGWTGGFRELHEQMRQSVESSMRGRRPTPTEVQDLVAYLHTLDPAPPLVEPQTPADQELAARGAAVFDSLDCRRCHVPALTYTTDGMFDVGLEDEAGVRKFNPPSLRGVSQRDAWLHDGRAATLEAVFTDWRHQTPDDLSDDDLRALVYFLKTL